MIIICARYVKLRKDAMGYEFKVKESNLVVKAANCHAACQELKALISKNERIRNIVGDRDTDQAPLKFG